MKRHSTHKGNMVISVAKSHLSGLLPRYLVTADGWKGTYKKRLGAGYTDATDLFRDMEVKRNFRKGTEVKRLRDRS